MTPARLQAATLAWPILQISYRSEERDGNVRPSRDGPPGRPFGGRDGGVLRLQPLFDPGMLLPQRLAFRVDPRRVLERGQIVALVERPRLLQVPAGLV